MRKTNNVVSEQVLHKPSCSSAKDGLRLEILDLRRGIYPQSEYKGAGQLTCAFVFTYAKCWFSHDVSHLSWNIMNKYMTSHIIT